jgi:hypothetical protein
MLPASGQSVRFTQFPFHSTKKGLRTLALTSLSRMKNWAEQCSEPQITGSKPLICLRVIRPSMPHEGQANTAQ